MHDLEITWPGGRLRFSPEDSPVLIGRSSSAAVVVPQGTVSRRHLTMSWNGRSWQAEDTSTHGSYDPIGVRLSPSWTLGTDVVVRLGSPRGVELAMRLITRAFDEQVLRDPYADPDAPPTVVDFGPPPRPEPSTGSAGLLHVADGGEHHDSQRQPVAGAAGAVARHDRETGHDDRALSPASEQLVDMGDISRFEPDAPQEASSRQPVVLDEHDGDADRRIDGGAVLDLRNGSPVVGLDGTRADRPHHERADSDPMDWSNPPNQPLDLAASRQPYDSGGYDSGGYDSGWL